MATGRLGAFDLVASTATTLYITPSGTFTIATVSICNRSSSTVTVRLAIALADTPLDSEWLEYETAIPSKGVLERTGLVLSAGTKLVVRSSAVSVNAVAFGIETSTT
jgi:hypothetical protein